MLGFGNFKALAAAAALVMTAGAASATPITITYTGGTAGGSATITQVPGGSGAMTGSFGAYGFNMTSQVGPLGNFVAWCLDLANYLGGQGSQQTYEITETPFGNSYGLDALQRGRVQAMFDANYDSVLLSDKDSAASFQAALWEVLYDGENYDLGSGDFRVTGHNGTDLSLATTYLFKAQGYGSPRMYNLAFLESTGTQQRQNLVSASIVPVPAAGLLLLTALGGLAFARRRHIAADAAV